MKTKKIPMRTCAECRQNKPKAELLRVVRTPDGSVLVDSVGKVSGRGTYICADENCLKQSIKTKALARALETEIPEEVYKALEKEING